MSGAFPPVGGKPSGSPAPVIPQQPAPMFSNPFFNSPGGFSNPMFNAQPGVPMSGGSIFNPSGSIAPARYGSVMGNSAQYGRGMTNMMPGNVSYGASPMPQQGGNPYMGGQAQYGYDDPGRMGEQKGAK